MPNQPKTPGHTIRIPDDEWQAARDKATKEDKTMTDVIRQALQRYVVGALAVACFVGGGWLAAGYLHPAQPPAPTQFDQTKIWNDLQQRADQLRQNLTPTPTPTTHDNTERSI